jgi:hypothetical protein
MRPDAVMKPPAAGHRSNPWGTKSVSGTPYISPS